MSIKHEHMSITVRLWL